MSDRSMEALTPGPSPASGRGVQVSQETAGPFPSLTLSPLPLVGEGPGVRVPVLPPPRPRIRRGSVIPGAPQALEPGQAGLHHLGPEALHVAEGAQARRALRVPGGEELALPLPQTRHDVRDHPLSGLAARLAGIAAHGEEGERGRLRDAGDVDEVRLDGPEERGLDLARVIAVGTVAREARTVGLEIRQAEEAHAEPRLQEVDQGLQVFPVGTVMAGQEDCRPEPQDLSRPHVIANVLEVDPRRDRGQPGPRLADLPLRPDRIAADLVDVPGVRRRHDAAVLPRRPHHEAVRLEQVEAEHVLRAVRLAEPVGEPDRRTGREGLLQFVRKHPFPTDLAHRPPSPGKRDKIKVTIQREHGPMSIEEQRARFLEDGYLIVPDALTPGELAPLRQAARAAEARWREDLSLPGVRRTDLEQVLGIMEHDPVFFALLEHPRIFPLVRDLLGPDVMMLDHDYFMTPPGAEIPNGWHFDFNMPAVDHPRSLLMVKVFYVLEDIPDDGGATLVLPRSHRTPLDAEMPNAEVPEDLPGAVKMALPAGSAYLITGRTYHSAGNNRSDRYRHLLIYTYGHKWMRMWDEYRPSAELAARAETPPRRQLLGLTDPYKPDV